MALKNKVKNSMDDCPSVNSSKILYPAEHEVWLSFPNDSGAATFCDWWNTEGEKLWLNYHEKNKEFYE